MFIGMEVMITENVKTDLDITNSTWGNIVGLILHPDKLEYNDNAVVKLSFCWHGFW